MVTNQKIAEWFIEEDLKISSGLSAESQFNKLLNWLKQAFDIFQNEKLFSLSKIFIGRDWTKTVEGVDIYFDTGTNFETPCTATDFNLIIKEIYNHIDKQRESLGKDAFPCTMILFGDGQFYDIEGNDLCIPNLIELCTFFRYPLTVEVGTRNDIWLPYSLDGKTKHEHYEINAPRLEKCLAALEQKIGITMLYTENGDYCDVNRFRLDNSRDYDGEIIPIDKNGHCLPS